MDEVERLRGIALSGPDLEPGERWDGPFRARILGNVETSADFIEALIAAVEERQDGKWLAEWERLRRVIDKAYGQAGLATPLWAQVARGMGCEEDLQGGWQRKERE